MVSGWAALPQAAITIIVTATISNNNNRFLVI
jgi:hypothetical protein